LRTDWKSTKSIMNKYAWYLDITPKQMFSLYDNTISGKTGLLLREEHGRR